MQLMALLDTRLETKLIFQERKGRSRDAVVVTAAGFAILSVQ